MNSECAVVFDIQRFSIHDGPGIRTTVFFKGCPLKCEWCQNPESHRQYAELAFYQSRCQACFLCSESCPEDAILTEASKRIDISKCELCGTCSEICPHQALRLMGKTWSVDALVEELKKDIDFFQDSEGGVTLSGGEPMLHASFLMKLLPQLKENGIHVNMETCGWFEWDSFQEILPFLDLVFFDLKHLDSKIHEKHTGRDNKLILENFTKLAASLENLQARMPIIPGVNSSPDNLIKTAAFLKQNNKHTIHCLPYHHLWADKLDSIEPLQNKSKFTIPTDSQIEEIRQCFEGEGIHAIFYEK